MSIGRIGKESLVRNMHQVGGQTNSVRKRDMKTVTEDDTKAHEDHITLSDQAKRGEKAGETTGMAGRQGSDEAKKKKDIENESKLEEVLSESETAEQEVLEEAPPEPHMPPGGYIHNEGPGGTGVPGGFGGPGGPGIPPYGAAGIGAGEVPPGGVAGAPSMADNAAKQKAMQDDMQQAQTIYMQMAADRQKWMMKMWEIMQETQTKIMEIMQEVAIRRARTMDSIAAKWAEAIRS